MGEYALYIVLWCYWIAYLSSTAIANLVCEHSIRQLKYMYFGDYVSGCEWLFSGKTSILCEKIGFYMGPLNQKKV